MNEEKLIKVLKLMEKRIHRLESMTNLEGSAWDSELDSHAIAPPIQVKDLEESPAEKKKREIANRDRDEEREAQEGEFPNESA